MFEIPSEKNSSFVGDVLLVERKHENRILKSECRAIGGNLNESLFLYTYKVNKSVTIEGQGKGATTVITTINTVTTMFNVTVSNVVFQNMSLIQDFVSIASIETIIRVGNVAATGIYVENREISVCEFGISLLPLNSRSPIGTLIMLLVLRLTIIIGISVFLLVQARVSLNLIRKGLLLGPFLFLGEAKG